MSNVPTPAELRAMADDIMGRKRRDTSEDVIEAHATQAPEADEERGYPPAGEDVERELSSGASDGERTGLGSGPGYDA